jgi:phosphohistidine swiveling domain-containing protein
MNDQLAIYKCADGTDFPVRWYEPEDATFAWQPEPEHFPLLTPPLEVALNECSVPARRQAYADAGLQSTYAQDHYLFPQGFVYLNRNASTKDPAAQTVQVERLLQIWGSSLKFWQQYCLPRIEEKCAALQMEAGTWTMQELADAWAYAYLTTHVASQVNTAGRNALRQFLDAEFGPDGDRLLFELVAGEENATFEADQALCSLADLAQNIPGVRDVFLNHQGSDLTAGLFSQVSGGDIFNQRFAEFLDFYGWRTEQWQMIAPTWRERPEVPLGLVRRLLRQGYRSPTEAMVETVQQREALRRETGGRLSPEKQGEMKRLIAALEGFVFVKEGRAHWQLTAYGSLRYALFLRGQRLQERDLIDAPADIFFLLPEEIEAALAGSTDPLRNGIAERKRKHAYWQTKVPPAQIGGSAQAQVEELALAADLRLIRGVGTSRGVVTGRACVIADVAEGERLQLGQILVCQMTSPSWTPLFTLASAVVTDTGGMLSHMSITAREYGIPCVCATKLATKIIPDGALIRVDGVAGTVEMLSLD